MTASLSAAIYDELKTATAARVPAAVVTIVKGEPLGAKMLILPDREIGSLGSTGLDAIAIGAAKDLLGEERSETRTIAIEGSERSVDLFFDTYPLHPQC